MMSPSLKISRIALALLFDLLSTPKMELSAEQFNAREEYRELLATRLLTPVSSTPTSACIDGRDHDILPNTTGPGFGYFSTGAGWMSVPMEALQRYRADPLRVFAVLRSWTDIPDRSSVAVLQHDAIWDLGDSWVGKRKLAVLFLRRAHLPKSVQQLQQTLKVFPRRKSAMVLTDVPINTFGPDLPGEPLCTDLMGLIPPGEEMVGAIDKDLIADLLGLGIPKRYQTGPVYCSEDGGELVVNGETYHFTGDIHRSIIRQLTDAWLRGEPRLRTTAVLVEAESNAKAISQAFNRCKTDWRKVVRYGNGFCWLIVDE
ncbi:hypothetical protein O1B68_002149 [Vibrio cholerae]|nr:hypothetical protein [Vibrio cholerae]